MRRATIALGLWLVSTVVFAGELEDLVAKYIAWRGGPAYVQLTSLSGEGIAEAAGLNGTFQVKQLRGTSEWSHVDLKAIVQTQATTPADAWTTTLSGQVENQDPATAQDARRALSIESGRALRGLDGATLALRPSEQLDGAQWRVVRVTFGDRDSYDLLINAADGSSLGVRAVEDGKTTFRRQTDWRVVSGVRVPFEVREERENAVSNVTYRYEKVSIGAAIEESAFARPSAPQRVIFAGAAKTTGWVDFAFFQNNRILIPAKLNGVTTTVLLDSGAESTVIDAAFAKSVGLRGEGSVVASGTGGESTVQLATGVAIDIAGLRLQNVTAALIDLDPISQAIGHPMPVILGKEILNETVVDIDFPNRRIAFNDRAGYKPPPGAHRLQLIPSKGIRAVPIAIEGREPILAAFDLGNGAPLDLFKSYWEGIGLLSDGRAQSTALGGGIGGIREHIVTTVRNVEFAGVTLNNVPTALDQGGEGAFDTDRTKANVGIGILRRFRLQLDFHDNTVYAIPDQTAIKQEFPKNRAGLIATFEAGESPALVVIKVAPNSPAARARVWKSEDRIVSINGQALTRERWNKQFWNWSQGAAGTKVILGLKSGEIRELVLADYF